MVVVSHECSDSVSAEVLCYGHGAYGYGKNQQEKRWLERLEDCGDIPIAMVGRIFFRHLSGYNQKRCNHFEPYKQYYWVKAQETRRNRWNVALIQKDHALSYTFPFEILWAAYPHLMQCMNARQDDKTGGDRGKYCAPATAVFREWEKCLEIRKQRNATPHRTPWEWNVRM